MKKRLLAMIMAVLMSTALLAGCTTKQPASSTDNKKEEEKKTIKVGFAVMDLANPFFVQVSDGFKEKAKSLGIEASVVDGKMDAAAQVSAIENFISQKVDVIVCSPVDSKAIAPLVKKAHEAGIKFVAQAQDVEGYDAWITVPEYDYGLAGGKMAGEWMKAHLNGPVEVAILDLPELKQIIDRAKGLEDGIKEKYPDAKIVAHQSASTPETGMKAAEIILQANPNVKVIAAINDAGALGAAEAVKAMKKDSNDFYVGGLDATPEALKKIQENGIYRGTIDINPKGIGGLVAETAQKLAKGETLSDKIIKVPMIPVVQK